MNIHFSSAPVESIDCDVLVVFAPEKKEQPLPAGLAAINQATGRWLDDIYSSGEFSGKAYETALLHRPPGLRARRLLAVGTGPAAKFDNAELSRAAGAAV